MHVFALPRLLLVTIALGAAAIACGDDTVNPDDFTSSTTRLQSVWQGVPQDFNESSAAFPQGAAQFVDNRTVRQFLRVSESGTKFRVHFSNLFGPGSLTINAAHIAVASDVEGGIATTTDKTLLFDGQGSVTIATGQDKWSDEVDFVVGDQGLIAISTFVQARTQVATTHTLGVRTVYTATGDQTSAATIPTPFGDSRLVNSYLWVTGVEARNFNPDNKVIVAFGDSITDGYASTVDADRRWPNYLDKRLHSDSAYEGYSIVGAAISGNRVLTDGIGPHGTSRYTRDLLEVSGAHYVTILLGINDLGLPYYGNHHANALDAAACTYDVGDLPTCNDDASTDANGEPVRTADEVTAGVQEIIDAAKAKDLRVYVGTLLPFGGAGYYTNDGETKRQAYNAWVRSSGSTGAIDGVIDFDALMQDPAQAKQMRAAYDSGDHLHPNDTGYAAMADFVDLSIFKK